MASLPASIWLSREERRALVRRDRRTAPAPQATPVCRYCFAPIANGGAFCSDDCENGALG